MARQWRIEYPGALYHVMSRGNGGQDIFLSDDDRQLFLDLLGTLRDQYNVEVHAYVLMGNHYHLLLKTNEANLSKAMQWFGATYTRKFNIKNNIGGHLFQGRFKSIIVENDAYLIRLSCYIHRNPLRAGIVDRLTDYPWSSYRYYAYRKKAPAWLTTEAIWDQLSGEDLQKAYRLKAQLYADEQNSVWEDVRHGLVYGSRDFVEDLKSRFLADNRDEELPQRNQILRHHDPEQFLRKAAEYLAFDLEGARSASRIAGEEKEKRDTLIYLLRKTGRLSNREIGRLMGLSYSMVSRVVSDFSGRVVDEKDIREKVDQVRSLFEH